MNLSISSISIKLLLLLALNFLLANCAGWKLEPYDLIPQVKTGATSNSATTSIQIDCQVESLGPNTLQEFGIVYSSSNAQPTVTDNKVTATGTSGSAQVTLDNLQPSTTYHYRTYAINNKGLIGYGVSQSFQTATTIADVRTLSLVGTPTATSIQVQVEVVNREKVTLKEYGLVYTVAVARPPLPTIEINSGKVSASTTSGINTPISASNLQSNTTYIYRAYAITSAGAVSYGESAQVTTGEPVPIVLTLDIVGAPSSTSAQVTVTNSNAFQLLRHGIVYSSTNSTPTLNDSQSAFVETTVATPGSSTVLVLNNLLANTTYNYRTYAISGTKAIETYGAVKTFKTAAAITLPTWKQLTNFSGIPRADANVFILNNKAYLFGGNTGSGTTNEVWEFDASSSKWIQKANLPRSGAYGVGFAYNGIGYVVCLADANQVVYPEILYYNNTSDKWTTYTDNNFKRFLVNATVIGNKAYVGIGKGQFTFVEYSILAATSRTISLEASLAKRTAPVMFPYGDQLYIGGGFVEDNNQILFSSSAYQLNPSDGKLTGKPNMPQAQMMGGVVLSNGRIFAIGITDSRLFEYKNEQWEAVDSSIRPSVKGGRVFFSIGNTIYYGLGYTIGSPNDRNAEMWSISF